VTSSSHREQRRRAAIMDVPSGYQKIFLNTGSNSDEIRGQVQLLHFLHEASRTPRLKASPLPGQEQEYKTFYILTSDYAFGHDLTRVTDGCLERVGRQGDRSRPVPPEPPITARTC